MWKRCPHILAPITETSVGNKGKQIEWTKDLEQALLDLKSIVSEATLLNYPDWTIPFTVHTYASAKQLGDVISQKNKPISFLAKYFQKHN